MPFNNNDENRTCAPRPERQKLPDCALRQLREKYEMSQDDLAFGVYVSRQSVWNWEHGRTMLPKSAMAIAEYFGPRDWRILLPRDLKRNTKHEDK